MPDLTGTCHCGAVSWRFTGAPDHATACNCTVCRRYGVLWAYGTEGDTVHTTGPTAAYARDEKSLSFHFCATCGCVAFWRSNTDPEDARRIAVNLRLADPDTVASIPVRHLDGLDSWTAVDRPARTVGDLWF